MNVFRPMCCNWYTFIENYFRWIIFSANMSGTDWSHYCCWCWCSDDDEKIKRRRNVIFFQKLQESRDKESFQSRFFSWDQFHFSKLEVQAGPFFCPIGMKATTTKNWCWAWLVEESACVRGIVREKECVFAWDRGCSCAYIHVCVCVRGRESKK